MQIYISLEPNKNKWLKACEKYNQKTESYFVENRYTSTQLKKNENKICPALHYL